MASGQTPVDDDWKTVDTGDWETVGDWQNAPAAPKPVQSQPEGSGSSRVLGGLWDTTLGGIGSAVKLGTHVAGAAFGGNARPLVEDLKGVWGAQSDQARQAAKQYQRGNYLEAAGHGLAAVLPGIGPAAAHAGERIGGTQPTYDKYGNVIQPGQAPDIAGGVGEGLGLVLGSSPRNIVGPVAEKVAQGLGKIPVPERITPEGMYRSALRPSLSQKNLPKIPQQVQTGLNERIPVSPAGLEKADSTIDAINQEIADRIKNKSAELGPVVSPKAVASRVEDVRPEFDTVNPEADQSAITSSKNEFLRKHSYKAPYTKIAPMVEEGDGFTPVGEGSTTVEKPLTLSDAQAEKQRTYTQLRKKYGELGSAQVESQKALARGLKEEIASRVPELSVLNARDGALIDLESQLERTIAREGNKNLLGLVPATMSHNPYGFLATVLMDNPAIKSRIAIALNRARQVINASGVGSTAAGLTTGGMAGGSINVNSPGQLPQYFRGGLIRRPSIIVDAATKTPVGTMAERGPEAIVPLSKPRLSIPTPKIRPPKLSTPKLTRISPQKMTRHMINSARWREAEQMAKS